MMEVRDRRCSECWNLRSSGSKSETVVPRSRLPAAPIAPAFTSSASVRLVLPEALWPTNATVRIDSVLKFGIAAPPV
jgi:hypothetical protein